MFRERARGCEFLDRPDADPRLVEQSYRFMKIVNRIGGGIRVVRHFLARELSQSAGGGPVTVLDIGAADCDLPLAITQWAHRRGHPIAFTCLDHDAKAVELAERAVVRYVERGLPHRNPSGGASPTPPSVNVVQADIFTYQPVESFDYAVGSMTFHHFADEEIDRLVAHLRGFVRKALLINDLHRCPANYLVCLILALRIDPAIRHDALLSIRRGFRPRELAELLAQHDPEAVVRRMWFHRIAGVVRFDRESHD